MTVEFLSALAEPTRLAVIAILADGTERCVCELMERLGVTQSRMSRHMGVLRQAGLVVSRRDAQWVRYKLNAGMPDEHRAILDAVLQAVTLENEDVERNVA